MVHCTVVGDSALGIGTRSEPSRGRPAGQRSRRTAPKSRDLRRAQWAERAADRSKPGGARTAPGPMPFRAVQLPRSTAPVGAVVAPAALDCGIGRRGVIAATITGGVMLSGGTDAPGYQPQTVTHTRGTTEISTEPIAVAAVGAADAQAAL